MKELIIFSGNLIEARETYGSNLAIRETGKPIKQVSGLYGNITKMSEDERIQYDSIYGLHLENILKKISACGIIRATETPFNIMELDVLAKLYGEDHKISVLDKVDPHVKLYNGIPIYHYEK